MEIPSAQITPVEQVLTTIMVLMWVAVPQSAIVRWYVSPVAAMMARTVWISSDSQVQIAVLQFLLSLVVWYLRRGLRLGEVLARALK
jgi:hypothetical protein